MTAAKMSAVTFVKNLLLFLSCCGLVHQLHAETEHPFLSEDQGKWHLDYSIDWYLCDFMVDNNF